MIIYTILALSFSIMFSYRYTKEIIHLVQEVAKVHEVKQQQIRLGLFAFWITILSAILMPAYALVILFTDRQKLIKDWSRQILLKYYDVELKNSC